ncbi:DUF4279 domain-containing protein [Streptomyces mobaraensis]|uniref:DUF4279 domain-containing protein n=1 Tax=Streptomyces mobaraensis TaxID=35621 RepID=UPI0033283A66
MVPVEHSWMVTWREPNLRVDEQIARLMDRLRPHTDRISDVTRHLSETGGGAALHVVRYFYDNDRAQPRATGAEFDVDEYDMSDGDPTG